MFERSIRFRDRSISWIRFRDRSITSMTSRNRQFPTFESFSFTFPYCFDSIWSKITENAWFQKWSIGSKWSNFVISFNSWNILRLFWAQMVKNKRFFSKKITFRDYLVSLSPKSTLTVPFQKSFLCSCTGISNSEPPPVEQTDLSM